jgi:hypothetical protein
MKSKFVDPASPYQIALGKRPEKKYPIDGPWLNGGLIKCFENYEKGVRYVSTRSVQNKIQVPHSQSSLAFLT